MSNIVPYGDIIIKRANERIKYIADITVDPHSKQFLSDLKDLANIIFSIEAPNNNQKIEKYINSVANELTRKTIKNLIKEYYILKQKQIVMHTNIDDIYKQQTYFNDIFNDSLQNNTINTTVSTSTIQENNTNQNSTLNTSTIQENSTKQLNKNFILSFNSLGEIPLSTKLENIYNIKLYSLEFQQKKLGKEYLIVNNTKVYLDSYEIHNIYNIIKYIDSIIKKINISIDIDIDTETVFFEYYEHIHDKELNLEVDFSNCPILAELIGFNSCNYIVNNILHSERKIKLNLDNSNINISIYINKNIPLIENYKITLNNLSNLSNISNNISKYIYNTCIESISIITDCDFKLNELYNIDCVLEFIYKD